MVTDASVCSAPPFHAPGTAERSVTWFADDLYRAVRPRIHLG
jgi:hypothetical protein